MNNNSQGLGDYVIGETYDNVYHLLLPFTIGDPRMTFVPVYINNDKRTCLSISKDNITIGDYVYINSIKNKDNNYVLPYYVSKGRIVNYSEIKLLSDNNFIIGNNIFDLSHPIGVSLDDYVLITTDDGIRPKTSGLYTDKIITTTQPIDLSNVDDKNLFGKVTYITAKTTNIDEGHGIKLEKENNTLLEMSTTIKNSWVTVPINSDITNINLWGFDSKVELTISEGVI